MTLDEACKAYLRDLHARNMSESTRNGYRSLFRQLKTYAETSGLVDLPEIDHQQVRDWRETWTCKPTTHLTRLKLLSAFFRFSVNAGWIDESPIVNLKPPRRTASPTMPFARDEMRRLLGCTEKRPGERALILLMRYSGLAIGDAVTLSKDSCQDSLLVLRRAKTGELVVVDLPDIVLEALSSIDRPDKPYYFWTGRSKRVTAAKSWRKRLLRVAKEAGVKGFRSHRLRDTFAVELLLNGVAMEDVSTLLGHGSISITERYYAPWCRARRDRLVEVVRAANGKDPIIRELRQGRLSLDAKVPSVEIRTATPVR